MIRCMLRRNWLCCSTSTLSQTMILCCRGMFGELEMQLPARDVFIQNQRDAMPKFKQSAWAVHKSNIQHLILTHLTIHCQPFGYTFELQPHSWWFQTGCMSQFAQSRRQKQQNSWQLTLHQHVTGRHYKQPIFQLHPSHTSRRTMLTVWWIFKQPVSDLLNRFLDSESWLKGTWFSSKASSNSGRPRRSKRLGRIESSVPLPPFPRRLLLRIQEIGDRRWTTTMIDKRNIWKAKSRR